MARVMRVLVLILSAAVLSFAWRWTPWGRLAYFEHATGLDLPAFPEDLDVYDNGEGVAVVYMVLAVDQSLRVTEGASFVELGEPVRFALVTWPRMVNGPSDLISFRHLSDNARRETTDPRLLGAGRCSSEISWHAFFEPKGRRLWVEVLSPDAAGSHAGCMWLTGPE